MTALTPDHEMHALVRLMYWFGAILGGTVGLSAVALLLYRLLAAG